MANTNGCCGGTTQNPQGSGAGYCHPVNVKLVQVEIDRTKLKGIDDCVKVFGVKAEITDGPLNQCPTQEQPSCAWCKWLPWILLLVVLLGLLAWAPWRGTNIASATMLPQQLAQTGQPVSATANPIQYVEVNVGGAQLASAGVKPSAKPAKPAVPAKPCKAVVFDSKAFHAFGVEVAREGANYAFTQTTGELASPNDIQAAQAAKKDGWITVVFDPSGAYAVNHKGNAIPVTMDASGRILVPVAQTQV